MSNILGKVWALPVTLVGLLYGLLEALLGAKVSIQHNAICFENSKLVRPFSAITLGNSIHCSTLLTYRIPTYASLEGLNNDHSIVVIGDHEEEHTYQYEKLGILFPIVWLLKGGPTATDSLENQADQYALTKKGKKQ